jgi:hypothetical protein
VLPCSLQSEKASCEWNSGLDLKPCREFNDEWLRFQVKLLLILTAKINLEVMSSNEG